MTDEALLDRLAALYGIQAEYHDIWGQRHRVSDATKKALLSAMGVPAGTDIEIRGALEDRERETWERVLPPVQVVGQGTAPFEIAFSLPAHRAGDLVRWLLVEESGTRHEGALAPAEAEPVAEAETTRGTYKRYAFRLPITPPPGYHRFVFQELDPRPETSLIVTPDRCYQPPALEGDGRVWGLVVQLYALRSRRNWGIGDFTDLKALIEMAAEHGAALVGVSPLHALFPGDPDRASPYSPSSRLFLNVLYLDLEGIPEFAECEAGARAVHEPEFQAALRALRAEELVDYRGVTTRKLSVLRVLYRCFRERHLGPDDDRGRSFRAYQRQEGEPLRRQALFEALEARFSQESPTAAPRLSWHQWPREYRSPNGGGIRAFERENTIEIEFFEYLQWQAFEQLAAVGHRSEELNLGVGIYQDLAAGIAPDGGEAWAEREFYALGAGFGSPPDDFNLDGQNWGLPPPIPHRLREAAYGPFVRTLRSNMRVAGALRIDHVMALTRLFWIPPGMTPREGAYVSYPFEDLLGILALESQRNRCLVIGEDLGTVPEVIRKRLPAMGILSYRLLYFEKTADGSFKPPSDYTAQALAAASTHDLPPLAGYWQGTDLELRSELNLFPSEEVRQSQIISRSEDRARLLMALDREHLLPEGVSVDPVSTPLLTPELSMAVHQYLARTRARIMTLQAEDCLGQAAQVNMPGTLDQHPNWRRKLSLDLEEWFRDARIQRLVGAVARERGVSETPGGRRAERRLPGQQLGAPRATYRLQFSAEFTFQQATELVGYLDALGISHCYASPYLRARPGSHHGYDIIDHNALNPEIGDRAAFERFVGTLRRHSMGHILDLVPNHMGIMGSDNTWWLDVLENGQASEYAGFFDIAWKPAKEGLELPAKVLVPVLGDHYGAVLGQGELRLVFNRESGAFTIVYYDHHFPVDPRSYPIVLNHRLERLERRLEPAHADLLEYQAVSAAFGRLPPCSETDAERVAERRRDKEIHRTYLAALVGRSADIAWFVDENLREFNGDTGTGFDLLHRLIEAQAYRLAYWRVAADEINYRRFFDVNELAALRMENEAVFEATHGLVLGLLESGKLDGLRIDHPDGLHDPAEYFLRIQNSFDPGRASDVRREGETGGKPVYLLTEKVLASYERLPADWRVHGTTGYDFLNLVNGLFVDPGAEPAIDRIYRSFIRERIDFDELAYDSKKLIMKGSLASELAVLANQLSRIAQADPRTCDFTRNSLRDALTEVVACFPVYRTYVSEAGASEDDRRYIEWAVRVARRRSHAADVSIFDFVRDVLLTDAAEGKPASERLAIASWAMRFQQYTAPVMAKGIEDTSFYIYNRLLALNEVGGDPRRFGTSVAQFHHANKHRLEHWPDGMLATSTHDTKRSEDVRARLDVLSEVPEEWRQHLTRWTRINRSRKRNLDNRPAPSRNDEYLLYQTLVGAWPPDPMEASELEEFRRRIGAYMLKAVREAKVHTSWINPDTAYEEAMQRFVDALLGVPDNNRFLMDLDPFARRLAPLGMFNSLAQVLLKMTAPGVGDFYQGNEIWDFSLVDPDNRRPVDYPRRRSMLDSLKTFACAPPEERRPHLARMLDTLEDGHVKMYVIWQTLELRRRQPQLFSRGDYVPLAVGGSRKEHLCAFARIREQMCLVVLAPRLFLRLLEGRESLPIGEAVWEDTWVELPLSAGGAPEPDRYWNVLTGEQVPARTSSGTERRIRLADALSRFPVGLLIDREEG